MPLWGEALVALVIALGLAGIVVPVMPGLTLIGSALLVWAIVCGGWTWVFFGVAAALMVAASVVKYLVAGSGMKSEGIPNSTLLVGGLAALVGFFVIPVLGAVIGFVLGAFAAETLRLGQVDAGWRGAVVATKAVVVAVGIELSVGLLVAMSWFVAAFFV